MLPVGDEDGGQGAPADMLEAVGDVLGGGDVLCVWGGWGGGWGGVLGGFDCVYAAAGGERANRRGWGGGDESKVGKNVKSDRPTYLSQSVARRRRRLMGSSTHTASRRSVSPPAPAAAAAGGPALVKKEVEVLGRRAEKEEEEGGCCSASWDSRTAMRR